ncbi:MAG: repeat-associated core domain protein [Acidobacteriales bacterium]|nr:repeat-associated core domain protein [Terriglobales bacterium]
MSYPRLQQILQLFIVLLMLSISGLAQNVATGTPPFGSFGGGPDVVNLGNLNTQFSVPIVNKPGRGIPFTYTLTYDSSMWSPASSSGAQVWTPLGNWGWTGQTQAATGYVYYTTQLFTCWDGGGYVTYPKYTFQAFYDKFGIAHPINTVVYYNECNGSHYGPATTTATDGSGYTFDLGYDGPTAVVHGRDGTLINAPLVSSPSPGTVTDSNGNQVSTNGAGVFTDTLGLAALTITGLGTPTSPTKYTYTDSTGAAQDVTVNYTSYTVRTNFGCAGVSQYGPVSVNLVSSVVYPDLSSYQFTYEATPGFAGSVTGRPATVKLPTGGTITYTYSGGSNGIICADGSTSGLTRQTPDGTTTYARSNPSGTQWTTTVTAANSDVTDINLQKASDNNFYEAKRTIKQGASTILQTLFTCYNGATGDCSGTSITLPVSSKSVVAQLENNYQSRIVTFYNAYSLPTEVDEYDFGSGVVGSLLRKTITAYASFGNYIVDKPSSVTVQDGSSVIIAQTSYSYDGTAITATSGVPQHIAVTGPRGNPTTISRWLNLPSPTSLVSTATYDDTGNVKSSIDPGGHTTTYSYSNANAYMSSITMPTTGTASHVTSATYDSNTGLVLSSTDENLRPTYFTYEKMLRPSSVSFADGGVTQYFYADPQTTEVKQKIDASNWIDQFQYLDSMGRPHQTKLIDPEGDDYTDTTYDSIGRVATVSNPHRVITAATDGTTTYDYDALNRVITITQPDTTTVQSSYVGNTVTVTDEAGKQRKSVADALGRMTAAFEPDSTGALNYETDYQYDTLNNLLRVDQKGADPSTPNWRTRTFTYDSLSRLLTATTPESGLIQYAYNADGNLTSKTDARSVATTLQYDALHRLTSKTYSDSTPSANFVYDGSSANNTVGRLSSQSFGSPSQAGNSFVYDAMGRVLQNSQCGKSNCGGTNYAVSATYNLAGELASLIYPSGRKIVNSYSPAARLLKVNYDSFSATIVNYAYYTVPQGATSTTWGYFPSGAANQFSLGNGVSESFSANRRLQMNQITASNASQTLLSKTYGFGTANNGNIQTITDNLSGGRTQTYAYDNMSRLASATTTASTGSDAWHQTYAFDPWGNMKQDGSYTFNAINYDSKNRISATGYTYDLAGNLTSDSSHTYGYDAEGRMKNVDAAATYTYAADGQRSRVDIGSSWTEYVYFDGQPIAEKTNAGDWADYIYAGGQRIAKAEGLDNGLHIRGTNSATSQYSLFYVANAGGLNGYTIRSGDKLKLAQYQFTGSKGGMHLRFTDGTNSNWTVTDQDGYYLNDDQVQATTHIRTVDLTALAGKILNNVTFDSDGDTAVGTWNIIFEQVALMSIDGKVQPIYTGQTSSPISSISSAAGVTSTSSFIDINRGKATNPNSTTNYYVADHLGSSKLMLSGYGYPVWSGTFLPLGQEWNPQITPNHYKFTGDEHDSESNLEHTQFRQLSTTQGRWTSPDPLGGNIDDPQSLNGYAYVQNNPVNWTDPLGLYSDGDDPWDHFVGFGGGRHDSHNYCPAEFSSCGSLIGGIGVIIFGGGGNDGDGNSFAKRARSVPTKICPAISVFYSGIGPDQQTGGNGGIEGLSPKTPGSAAIDPRIFGIDFPGPEDQSPGATEKRGLNQKQLSPVRLGSTRITIKPIDSVPKGAPQGPYIVRGIGDKNVRTHQPEPQVDVTSRTLRGAYKITGTRRTVFIIPVTLSCPGAK